MARAGCRSRLREGSLKKRKETLEIGQMISCIRLAPLEQKVCVNHGVEPRGKQHLLGSVPGKELLKQGIWWPESSAAQRTVLLLWH